MRRLEHELKGIAQKQRKSKWYHGKKASQAPSPSPEPTSSSQSSSVPSSPCSTDTSRRSEVESAGCSMDESMSGNEKANDHQSELHSQPCQMESESCSILEPIQESDQDSHSEDDRSTVVVSSEAEESPSVCHSPVNIHTPRLQREDAFIHSPSTSHSFW